MFLPLLAELAQKMLLYCIRVFKKLADDLETTLQEDAKKEREVPFQQGARPTEAYKLGNHPAFRGIAGVNEGEDDEPAVMEEAGASKRAVVAKV